MFPVHIIPKLEMFREEEYTLLEKNEETCLKEESKDGEVELNCRVSNKCIVIRRPEKNVLAYLDSQKKGARQCADIFIYKFDESIQKWELHIIELKKTINTQTIDKSKHQLTLGIYNARAVSAFLGFDIENIILYSGYRNDRITSMETAALIQIRAANNGKTVREINEWKKGICTLNIDEKGMKYEHRKIQLDQNGYGSLII